MNKDPRISPNVPMSIPHKFAPPPNYLTTQTLPLSHILGLVAEFILLQTGAPCCGTALGLAQLLD